MNSRERVLAVFRGETPDRVPWGEFAVDFDTVERVIGRETFLRAKARSQIALWEGRREEVVESWRRDAIDFYRAMSQLDMVTFPMASWNAGPTGHRPTAPGKVGATTWRFADGRVLKYSEATRDITCVEDPNEWSREFRIEDFPLPGEENWQEPQAPDASLFEVIDAVIAEFREERFIAGICGGEIGNPFFNGMQRGMVEMLERPDLVERMVRHNCARQCAADAWMVRDGQDGVLVGADFAFNSGPFISPRDFRRFVTPYARQRAEALHARGQLFLKHACGNNEKLLDQFREIGYDCYQSLQLSAGMDLERVRELAGPDLVLWGNLALEVLQGGSPEEVRKAVRETVEKGKRVGRFIFGSSHSIAVGTPYENFLAMTEEFEKVRDY
jgi:uroporphyrinogen decarboxylase